MKTAASCLSLTAIAVSLVGIPVCVALKRRAFYLSDLGLLLLPPLLFIWVGCTFNEEMSQGYGIFIYPFAVLFASALLLYLRVFILDRFLFKPRLCSLICLVVAMGVAVFMAMYCDPLGC